MTRWGSLARSGLPVTVREPETVQSLLPSGGASGKWTGTSLPTRFLSKAGDSPEKSIPGAGSSFTGGSRSRSCGFFRAEKRNQLRVVQFARAVSCHRVRGQAVQAIFGLPGLGLETCKLEFDGETNAAGLLN